MGYSCDQQFARAKEQRIIHPNCTRQDLIDWRRREAGVNTRVKEIVTFEIESRPAEHQEETWHRMDTAVLGMKHYLETLFPEVTITRRASRRPLRTRDEIQQE